MGAQAAELSGREQTATQTNYYLGNDPRNWHLNVPSYRSVAYAGDIEESTSSITAAEGGFLEYDFRNSPGADPTKVRMRFDGLKRTLQGKDLSFEGQDQLSVRALKAFRCWTEKKRGDADWEIVGDQASIRLGSYDRRRALIIDPVFFYGTYIGGSANDAAVSIVPASQPGYFYVALSSSSPLITEPTQSSGSPPQNPNTTGTDTLILGIDDTSVPPPPSPLPPFSCTPPSQYPALAIGSATYIGGTTGNTKPTAMAADQSFNLYITGTTDNGANFPQLGTQTCSQSCTGSFIAKFATSVEPGAHSATLTLPVFLWLAGVS